MTPRDPLLYFAYGSNMLSRRLRARVPSATSLSVGHLVGHRLRWHMPSRDGSAKCDAEQTGRTEDAVWGVVFRIDAREKPALDLAEALGQAYRECALEVHTASGVITAFAYLALKVSPGLAPYAWYKDFVVSGAIEHDLPDEYLQTLRAAKAMADPDPMRDAMNRRLLSFVGTPASDQR